MAVFERVFGGRIVRVKKKRGKGSDIAAFYEVFSSGANGMNDAGTRSITLSADRSQLYIDKKHPTNVVRKNFSTFIDFIPNCIILILTRSAYIFYFVIFLIQIFYKAPLGISIEIVPLTLLLSSSALLDIIKFFRRRKLTNKIDKRKVTVLRENEWIQIPWKALTVGDIIKLSSGDVAPADLILLCSINGSAVGVDTHIIDGSNQLKARKPHPALHFLANTQSLNNCSLNVEYSRNFEGDNKFSSKLKFNATVSFNTASKVEQIKLNNQQFIERYSVIYNVSDIICGVMYTGVDCRTVESNSQYPFRVSKLETFLNIQNSIQIGLVLFFASLSAGCSLCFINVDRQWPFYIQESLQDAFFSHLWNFIILLLPLIPIELYILIDIILIIHSFFIQTENSIVSNIPSITDLCQLDSIILPKSLLFDKKIRILRIYVNEKMYGQGIASSQRAMNIENELFSFRYDSPLFEDFKLQPSEDNHLFFLHLCLCHSAIPIIVDKYIGYFSNLSEEEPLIKLAQLNKYIFTKRNNGIYANIFDRKYFFPVIVAFPPSPTHPRTSIVFKDIDGTIKLFTRGDVENMRDFVSIPEEIEFDLKSEGLRVICSSYKIFNSNEIQYLQTHLQGVLHANPDSIFKFANNLEKNSNFLSLIALEEEPKKGVLEVVNHAKAAGIQITLISPLKANSLVIAAISLGLIKSTEAAGVINGNTLEEVREALESIQDEFVEVLVIAGRSVEFLNKMPTSLNTISKCKKILLEMANPQQVAIFTTFLKHEIIHFDDMYIRTLREPDNRTDFHIPHSKKKRPGTIMAVGDSVYDSLCLQAANVGISIRNEKVNPCDISSCVSINDFETLDNLIFVHGELLRDRLSSFLRFIFMRDAVFAYMTVVYGFHSAFSGTPLFKEWQIMIIIIFSSIPAVSQAIFNQKTPISILKKSPEIYRITRIQIFSILDLFLFNLFALIAAAAIIETTGFILHDSRTYNDTISLSQFSFCVESILFICSLCFLLPNCRTWTKAHHIFSWGSIILYFLLERVITDHIGSKQSRGSVLTVTTMHSYNLILLFFAGISLFLTMSHTLIKRFQRNKVRRRTTTTDELLLTDIRPCTSSSPFTMNVSDFYI